MKNANHNKNYPGIPLINPRLCEVERGQEWRNEEGQAATVEGVTSLVTIRFGDPTADKANYRYISGHTFLEQFTRATDSAGMDDYADGGDVVSDPADGELVA